MPDAPEGEYQLVVLATENGRSLYTEREAFSNVLNISILDGCRITQFEPLSVENLQTTVKGDADVFTFAAPKEFYLLDDGTTRVENSCGTKTYAIFDSEGVEIPAEFILDLTGRTLTLQTDDPADLGLV